MVWFFDVTNRLFIRRSSNFIYSYVCYLFQVHPIEITESTKSPNTNLSTPWTVESGTMCELDVFVGNYAIIDWEVYSLWLSGRSIAEAGPVQDFSVRGGHEIHIQGVPN